MPTPNDAPSTDHDPRAPREPAGPPSTYLGRLADLWTLRAIAAAVSILGLSLTLRFAFDRPLLARVFLAPFGAAIVVTLYLARENVYEQGLPPEDRDAE